MLILLVEFLEVFYTPNSGLFGFHPTGFLSKICPEMVAEKVA